MGTLRMLAAARRKRSALLRKGRQLEFDEGLKPTEPLRSWLFSCLLGLILVPLTVLLANIIANFPRGSTDAGIYALDSFAVPKLGTGETLGTLGVLATVVVALAFARGRDELPPGEAAAQALNLRRLSTAAAALGAAATALSITHVAGHAALISREGDRVTSLFEAASVLLAGQAIAFTAAQTQPRPGELALAASVELPRLLQRHRAFLMDQRLRWGFHARDRAGVPALVSAGVLVVVIPVLLFFLVGALAHITFSGDDGAVAAVRSVARAGFGVAAVLGMLTIFSTMWDHLWPTIAIAVLGGIAIAAGAVGALVGTLHDAYWAGFYWLAWGTATSFIWPFALISYPANVRLRRVLVFLCWPLHILRLLYFGTATNTRRKVIAIRHGLQEQPVLQPRPPRGSVTGSS